MTDKPRIAIVLFNLGGPDSLEAVRPFLVNLFYDPAITEAPAWFRWLFARLITAKRLKDVRANYEIMGGKTPLLEETRAQARALESALADEGRVRCFVAMRYWHPMAEAAAAEVLAFAPDRLILLPLYPQYANATTGSSLRDWREAADRVGLAMRGEAVCCYPTEPGFVDAHAGLIRQALEGLQGHERPPRLLFSAHGLPESFIRKGDPYQWQIEQTCAAVVRRLGIAGLDWLITYQSRVGPQKWIEPYTEVEVERAGKEGRPVVMVPIAFVSEHIETLVEMDDEYRELAVHAGAPAFVRVPTPTVEPSFIEALATLVRRRLRAPSGTPEITGPELSRLCPAEHGRCPCALAASEARAA
jgi:protoporphyrin/coproporphyrin ferrochelatase